MRTVTYKVDDLKKVAIHIGRAEENEATRVQIDAGSVFAEYPAAVPAMKVISPAGVTYSREVTRDGDMVVWDVVDSDLAAEGYGEMQLTFTENSVKVKSAIAQIRVCRSISGGTTPPDPVQDWLDEAEAALDAFPTGGTTGQVLAKKSNDDYDTEWVDQGSGGTTDYTDLTNKPQIGGVTLNGNKSLNDLGAASAADVSAKYTKPAGGIPASDIADGVIPDPEDLIDDEAGEGDTDKVWSADKTDAELADVKSAITNVTDTLGMNGESIDRGTGHPLSLSLEEGTKVFLEFNTAESYFVTGKNLCSLGTVQFTQAKKYSMPYKLPQGQYVFSCVATSTDTDSTKCMVCLFNGSSAVTTLTTFDRGTRQNIVFNTSAEWDAMYFYASNDYSTGAGDTATFADIQVEKASSVSAYEEYAGVIKTVQDNNILEIENNPTLIFTNDFSNVHGYTLSVEPVVPTFENELFEKEWESVNLTMIASRFYLPNGTRSSYNEAYASEGVPVTPGETLKVTASTQLNIPGILFFNSSDTKSTTFVSNDCYTGETVTFTDESVTVPAGASYAVVQGNSTQPVVLKRYVSKSKIDKINNALNVQDSDDKYMESVMCNRLMTLGKKAGFSWGTYSKVLLTIRVDDLRTDIDKVAKIIMDEYNFPMVAAACAGEMNKTVTGITTAADKIGDTRLEVLQWIQEHGGEVVVHPDNTITSANYETSIKPLLLDSKRKFEDNGIRIRGTALANTAPSSDVRNALDPYLYGFYDYADNYGNVAPYRYIYTEMMSQWASDPTTFSTWLNTRISTSDWVWRTLVLHQLGDDISESALRSILDAIDTAVDGGHCQVVLWSDVFDTYGT